MPANGMASLTSKLPAVKGLLFGLLSLTVCTLESVAAPQQYVTQPDMMAMPHDGTLLTEVKCGLTSASAKAHCTALGEACQAYSLNINDAVEVATKVNLLNPNANPDRRWQSKVVVPFTPAQKRFWGPKSRPPWS